MVERENTMIFEINNKQAGIDENVLVEVKRMLQFSLSRFEGVSSHARVRFFDINGPKGGSDKRCRVSVKLRTSGQIVVLGEGANYIEALSNSLDRLVRSIVREIQKKRESPIRQKRRNDHTYTGQDETIVE